MTRTEQLLGVTRAYQALPSLQTTTPGPTARAAGTVTLVRGVARSEGGTEKESREARAAGLAVESESLSGFKARGKWKRCALGRAWGRRASVSGKICRIWGTAEKDSMDRIETTEE